jgi:hypothetical protein
MGIKMLACPAGIKWMTLTGRAGRVTKGGEKRMRRSLKYVLVLIPFLVLMSGCYLLPKQAEIHLTITPSITRIGTEQVFKITLRESNGVGVNLNRLEYRTWDKLGNLVNEQINTGTRARALYLDLFATTYLPGNSALIRTFWHFWERGPEGKREYLMGGQDVNGNIVETGAVYLVKP